MNSPQSAGNLGSEELTLAAPPPPDGATLPPPAEGEPEARANVAGYERLQELGRGGMGVVYKARQVGLNRVVALKMILAGGHAGGADLARFRTEAEAIARLQHPGIVQVFEVGEQEGMPFLSLEYCEGGSLDRKLAGTPLPPHEAATLVRRLAEAVQVAHDAKVLHRDLKPANVLLTADGTPKLTDFGLAKKLDEQGQTQTGSILGTPSYMAPEQAEGKKDVGPAADIYALGAILYECLTGRPPFKAATPLDTILQVVSADPVPPRLLNTKVPADLEAVTLQCLAKNPTGRYASAAELADDLGRAERGEPTLARPGSAWSLLKGWLGRNLRAAVCVLAVGMVAGLLMGAAAYLYLLQPMWQVSLRYGYHNLPQADWPWLARLPQFSQAAVICVGILTLLLLGQRGLLVVLLTRPRSTAAELSFGLAVGLVSGFFALMSGFGWAFVGGNVARVVNDLDNKVVFRQNFLNQDFEYTTKNDAGEQVRYKYYAAGWHLERYPDLRRFSAEEQRHVLYDKLVCDVFIATQVGLLKMLPLILVFFVVVPVVETMTAGSLLRRHESAWRAAPGYAEQMVPLVAFLGFLTSLVMGAWSLSSQEGWFSRFLSANWVGEVFLLALLVAQAAAWRGWHWGLRLALHAAWVTLMLLTMGVFR